MKLILNLDRIMNWKWWANASECNKKRWKIDRMREAWKGETREKGESKKRKRGKREMKESERKTWKTYSEWQRFRVIREIKQREKETESEWKNRKRDTKMNM